MADPAHPHSLPSKLKHVVSPELIKEKVVLLRMDLDIPILDGKIQDDFRLKAGLPTLELCLAHADSVVICGHIGRPNGREVPDLSVAPIVEWLENWYCDLQLPPDSLHVLENLRFEDGEDAQDPNFAKELASYANFFVNDSFAGHHPASSTTLVPTLLPSAAGLRFAYETDVLLDIRNSPKKPLIAIIGGAKIEDKYQAVVELSKFCDFVLVGGLLPREIKSQSLPVAENVILGESSLNGLDLSDESIEKFTGILKTAKQVIWAGPVGRFEDPNGNKGNKKLAEAILASDTESIIGGGETITALKDNLDKFDLVSIGGGAMLKLLSEGTLPTIEALNDSHL